MSTTKPGYWIRVQDGNVTDVWDTVPPYDTEAGWREAVEIIPDTIPHREYLTTHYFNLEATPAEIIWNVGIITPEERKASLVAIANGAFQEVVQREMKKQIDEFPETQYDAEAVDAARIIFENRRNEISAVQTHEEIDSL